MAWLSIRRRVHSSAVWLLVHPRHINQTLQPRVFSHVITHLSTQCAGKQIACNDSTGAPAHLHMCSKMQLRTQHSASHIPGGQLVNAGHIMQS